jgi:anti-sigma factor RsiW
MSGETPFDPHTEAPLLSAYVDGELDPGDVARIEAHLEHNPDTRQEVEALRRLKLLTGAMMLKEAPPENWEVFWQSVYNRSERSLGWILWMVFQSLLGAESLPLAIKAAIIVGTAGVLILLVSVVRERLFKRNRTRYKDVIR